MIDKKLIEEVIYEYYKRYNIFFIVRNQLRKTQALRYDGEKYIFYNDDEEGMGIQAVSKIGNIAFFRLDNANEREFMSQIDKIRSLTNEYKFNCRYPKLYDYYTNSPIEKISFSKQLYAKNDIEIIKKLLKKEYEFLASRYSGENFNTYFLEGGESWQIIKSNRSIADYDYLFSSLRHTLNVKVNNDLRLFQVSIFGQGTEILEQETSHNKKFKKKTLQKLDRILELEKGSEALSQEILDTVDKIVIDYEVASVLIHEIVGHALEEDMINPSNYFSSCCTININNKVCDANITITDSSTEGYWGYQPCNADGYHRIDNVVIDNGKLITGLNSMFSNSMSRNHVTNSDRIETYRNVPLPRMSNFSMKIDDTVALNEDYYHTKPKHIYDLLTEKKIISSDDKVLFLLGSNGGKINVVTNKCRLYPQYCCIIENNQIKVLSDKNIKVDSKEFLNSIIKGIGDIDNSYYCLCEKKGQKIGVSGGSHSYILCSNFKIEL